MKKIIAVFLAAVMALSITACGNNEPSAESQTDNQVINEDILADDEMIAEEEGPTDDQMIAEEKGPTDDQIIGGTEVYKQSIEEAMSYYTFEAYSGKDAPIEMMNITADPVLPGKEWPVGIVSAGEKYSVKVIKDFITVQCFKLNPTDAAGIYEIDAKGYLNGNNSYTTESSYMLLKDEQYDITLNERGLWLYQFTADYAGAPVSYIFSVQ